MSESTISRSVFNDVMMPNYSPLNIIPVKGEGSKVWDQNGKDYIDFATGIAVSCLGHTHPNLVKALVEQGNSLWHLSNVMTNEPALRLGQKLTNSTFADKVFFCNSGTEANEAALKLARRHCIDTFNENKTEIISFHNSFHGRSLFTVSVGGQPKYSERFGPIPGDITHLPFNDTEAFKNAISEKTCAVILEPIQGEGGILPADPEFLQEVRNLCSANNALLIFDEVQCGMGRSGSLYAYMEYGIEPDILTNAKGLGGGFPIGVMMTTDEIAKSLAVGTHGSTYGGNPLACAVAEAVIDTVNQTAILDDVKRKHQLFVDGLNTINDKFNVFTDVRGMGLLIGAEISPNVKTAPRDFLYKALEHGLFLLTASTNVIRIAPSLIIPDEDIIEGLKRMEDMLSEIEFK